MKTMHEALECWLADQSDDDLKAGTEAVGGDLAEVLNEELSRRLNAEPAAPDADQL